MAQVGDLPPRRLTACDRHCYCSEDPAPRCNSCYYRKDRFDEGEIRLREVSADIVG